MAEFSTPRTRSPSNLTTWERRPATPAPTTATAPSSPGGVLWTLLSGPTSRSTTPTESAPYGHSPCLLSGSPGGPLWAQRYVPLCLSCFISPPLLYRSLHPAFSLPLSLSLFLSYTLTHFQNKYYLTVIQTLYTCMITDVQYLSLFVYSLFSCTDCVASLSIYISNSFFIILLLNFLSLYELLSVCFHIMCSQ